jgi:hypothetical protein
MGLFDAAFFAVPDGLRTLIIDGVYVQQGDGDPLVFHPLPAPTHAEVATVAGRIAQRAEAVMRKHGRWVDGDSTDSEPDQLSLEQPVLSACYQGCARGIDVLSERAGRPTLRLMTTPPVLSTNTEPGPVAVVRGFNLHAATAVDGCDRDRLERLCQYIGRPPIAEGRLHVLGDGQVRYDMKRVWADGTSAIVLDPLDFIASAMRTGAAAVLSHGPIQRTTCTPLQFAKSGGTCRRIHHGRGNRATATGATRALGH